MACCRMLIAWVVLRDALLVPALRYHAGITKPRKKKVFLDEAQQALLVAEYAAIKAGDSNAGTLAELCERFQVDRTVPSKLFAKVKRGAKPPASRKGVGGRKRTIGSAEAATIQEVLQASNYDPSFREIADATGIPKSTVHEWWKQVAEPNGWRMGGKRYIPLLTEAHKTARLKYARQWRKNGWFRHVEVDEKWFYATSMRRRLKLPPGVKAPKLPVTSKRFVPKVMVLTAIARPMPKYGFDGKIGCWRVAKPSVAINNSKNRPAGAAVMKDITLDGDTFRAFMIRKVFKAIREKMSWSTEPIKVQFDNARPHVNKKTMAAIKRACTGQRGAIDIEIIDQPAQSPDCNANDLGFYASIDSEMPRYRCFDLDGLFKQVERAYKEYPAEKLTKLFETKMLIMEEIIKVKGDNDYQLPHKKQKK